MRKRRRTEGPVAKPGVNLLQWMGGAFLSLGLLACSAEAVTSEERTPIAGAGEFSDEGGLFPSSEWNAVTALAALGSGDLTLHYRGPIDPGEAWVDPETADVITVEALEALLTAPTFFVVPSDAVPSDVETADRLTMVALAFADAHGEVSLQPGLRPRVSLDDGLAFPAAGEKARIIIAGKSKKDGNGVDTDFDTTDWPPGTVHNDPDQPNTDTPDTDPEADADQWDPTQDSDSEEQDWDVDEDTQEELDKMWEDHQKKKNESN